MGQSLTEIAQTLKNSDKKVQLIYAFNGSGKTRLSREFKELMAPKNPETEEEETKIKIMYYNAFTEDLFYWDNDLENDEDRKLKIQPNNYTNWVLVDEGQELNITKHFQRYTNDKLTPEYNSEYTIKDKYDNDITIPAFSEVHFSFKRGNDETPEFVKISKGEESCFIWSVFYSLLAQTISVLNKADVTERDTDQFNDLQYVFIDDPVSSLDDSHLIELAVNIAVIDLPSRKYQGTITGSYLNLRHIALNNGDIYLSSNKFGAIQKAKLADILKQAFDEQHILEYKNWQTVMVGAGARTIDVTADGKYTFACVNNACKVVVIDNENMKVIYEVRAEAFPVGMALSPNNKQLIVTSQGKDSTPNSGNAVMVFDVDFTKKRSR